jgi:hypothetical protein
MFTHTAPHSIQYKMWRHFKLELSLSIHFNVNINYNGQIACGNRPNWQTISFIYTIIYSGV